MHAPLTGDGGGGDAGRSIWTILGTAALAVLGIMCHVWACTIEQNAMPVLILIAYFLTPLPRLLGNICDQGNMFSAMQPAVPLSRLWGDFGTAFIGLWVLGIPALLVHAEKVPYPTLAPSPSALQRRIRVREPRGTCGGAAQGEASVRDGELLSARSSGRRLLF